MTSRWPIFFNKIRDYATTNSVYLFSRQCAALTVTDQSAAAR